MTLEQHLYQTIVQFDETIVLPRKLATGNIHNYLFWYCPLVGILFEVLRIVAYENYSNINIIFFNTQNGSLQMQSSMGLGRQIATPIISLCRVSQWWKLLGWRMVKNNTRRCFFIKEAFFININKTWKVKYFQLPVDFRTTSQ